MGLFDSIKKVAHISNEKEDLEYADQLFSTLIVGPEPSKKATQFSSSHSRKEVLEKIMKLCEPYDTPHARYIIALAYAWFDVSKRKEAIVQLNRYLNNDLYTDLGNRQHYSVNFTAEQNNNIITATMYSYLGKCFEGEYEFDNALVAYQKARKLDTRGITQTLQICNVLIKMNNIDGAIKLLKSYKTDPSSSPENKKTDLRVKKNYLDQYTDKKDKGYVYKPRKKEEKKY